MHGRASFVMPPSPGTRFRALPVSKLCSMHRNELWLR